MWQPRATLQILLEKKTIKPSLMTNKDKWTVYFEKCMPIKKCIKNVDILYYKRFYRTLLHYFHVFAAHVVHNWLQLNFDYSYIFPHHIFYFSVLICLEKEILHVAGRIKISTMSYYYENISSTKFSKTYYYFLDYKNINNDI